MATSHLSILSLLFLSLSPLSHAGERCNPNDKKALLQIKKDLNNPYDFASWIPNTDCCDWYVVKCDDTTNRIIEFTLDGADLKLPVPASVGELPYLLRLNIIRANVTGEIPEAITKLSQLKLLELSDNLLTGPVPSFLSQLKKLSYLGLSFNSFTGSIPASLSKLSQLNFLNLRDNHLTGPVPSFLSQLKNLSYIGLSSNSFTGSIPASLTQLSQLEALDLRENLLTGPVPSFLSQLKKLKFIGLSSNSLTGSIPASLFQLTELMSLFLAQNNLTGGIPASLGYKKKQEFFLSLSHNQLSGPIPATLGYTNFSWFDVSSNRLEGDISFMFGKNKSLITATFSRNLFQFDFSNVEISESLSSLFLDHNKIFGSVPSGLAKIRRLFLDQNNLTGGIPASLGYKKEQDFYLSLSHNQLSGPIPATLGYTNFSLFDVSSNRLEGDISFMFGKNKSLHTAIFSRNVFQFDFSNVEISESLRNLYLDHNKIFGSVPSGLAKIDLITMDLSYNSLCGRIPVGGRLQELDYTAYFHNRCLCGKPLPTCK